MKDHATAYPWWESQPLDERCNFIINIVGASETPNTPDAWKKNASLIVKVPFFKDTRHSKNPEISKTRCGASLRKITLLRTLDENRNPWIGWEMQFHYQYSRRVRNAKYPRCIKNASLIAKVPFFAKDTGHSKNPEISKTRCGASLQEITACKKSCTESDV